MTFDAETWNIPQRLDLESVGDDDAVDGTPVPVAFSARGGDYAALTAELTVSVDDDDTAAIVFTGAPVTVVEGDAGGGSYTVALGTQPSASVTVTAAGDGDAADETINLDLRAEGGDYGSVTGTVTVNVDDDDTAAIVFTGAPVTVVEGDAGGGSYTVALGTQPSASVTVTIDGQSGTGLTLSSARLVFTALNWATAQTVTVTAAGDGDAADETVVLTHTAAGGDYGSVTGTVTANVDDDDTAAIVFTGAPVTVVVTLVQIPTGRSFRTARR